jgi:hypothetical protein
MLENRFIACGDAREQRLEVEAHPVRVNVYVLHGNRRRTVEALRPPPMQNPERGVIAFILQEERGI